MSDWLEFTKPAPLSTVTVLVNLGIGLVLGVLLGAHYVRFGRTLCNRTALSRILVAIVLTTVLVISVVKASLALSLGLVGALSIVRFRTPIKEPEELAYLFLAIATGLGLGADQRVPTIAAVAVILVLLTIHARFSDRRKRSNLYLNIEIPSKQVGRQQFERLAQTVADRVATANLRRMDVGEDLLQATFFVGCHDDAELFGLLNALQDQFPSASVSFVDQSQGLEG